MKSFSNLTSVGLAVGAFFFCFTARASADSFPDLGAAAGYAVLEISNATVSITQFSGITGDVGIGASGAQFSMRDKSYVTGTVYLATGAVYTNSSSGFIGGVQNNQNLSQAVADAHAASAAAAALTPTLTLSSVLTTNYTVVGNGGLNVISLAGINYGPNSKFTLSGSASDFFVVNVSDTFALRACFRSRFHG